MSTKQRVLITACILYVTIIVPIKTYTLISLLDYLPCLHEFLAGCGNPANVMHWESHHTNHPLGANIQNIESTSRDINATATVHCKHGYVVEKCGQKGHDTSFTLQCSQGKWTGGYPCVIVGI